MISYIQAIILGLLQGFTELFPVSSLGHSVILPSLLGWNIDQSSDSFLIFIILTHLATALALLVFFGGEWIDIIIGFIRSLLRFRITGDSSAKLAWFIVIGTIPAGLVGLLLEKKIQELFASPVLVSIVLILNGLMLFAAEFLRRRNRKSTLDLTWSQAFLTGLAQCLALIPGFSRTGSTLSAGLAEGLSHESAARFSFLLATPIILAAALLKLPHAILHPDSAILLPSLIGAICSAGAAYFSVRFLSKYFKTKTLTPFGLYCIVFGLLSLAILH